MPAASPAAEALGEIPERCSGPCALRFGTGREEQLSVPERQRTRSRASQASATAEKEK